MHAAQRCSFPYSKNFAARPGFAGCRPPRGWPTLSFRLGTLPGCVAKRACAWKCRPKSLLRHQRRASLTPLSSAANHYPSPLSLAPPKSFRGRASRSLCVAAARCQPLRNGARDLARRNKASFSLASAAHYRPTTDRALPPARNCPRALPPSSLGGDSSICSAPIQSR